jgi:hypothetical protein
MNVEPFINIADMRAHGFDADAGQAGDFFVAIAFGQAGENLVFAVGTSVDAACDRQVAVLSDAES